jgi:hypothetical protein
VDKIIEIKAGYLKIMNKTELTAPCGLDCFNCPIYEGNITDEIKRKNAAATGVNEEDIPCKGCLGQRGGFYWMPSCATYECVMARGLRFCFECDEFPCSKLQPAVDGANFFPHNMKVYNLCRIKAVGVEQWAEAEASEIRKRYYQGKFKVGFGPQLQ